MLNLFRQNNPYVLVFIPLIIIVFLTLNILFPYHLSEPDVSFGLWGRIQEINIYVNFILSSGIISIIAILINGLFNRNEFSEKNNFLPSILYITYLSFFHSFYFINGLLITQFFLILMIRQLLRLRQKDDGRKIVFNASFLFGIAATFFPLLIFGLPFLFLIVWVSRPFILRESALLVIGTILPFIYSLVYIVVLRLDVTIEDLNSSSSELFILDMWLIIGSLFLFFLMGIGTTLKTMNSSSIRLKKVFRMILLLTVFTFGMFILEAFTYKKIQTFCLFFLPVAFVLPYAFGESKLNQSATTLYYILLLFTITKFFIPYESFLF